MVSVLRITQKTFAALLIVFVCTEVLLRIINPAELRYYRNIKMLHRYNDSYYVGLAPNADIYIKHHMGLWEGRFTTNSYGYRGSSEVSPSKDIVACSGDSMVMGFGVSDHEVFCSLLEEHLTLNGKKMQMMNLGVDAYGSMASALRIEEASKNLPNLKLLLFFVSPNDFVIGEELRARGVLPDDVNEEQRENNPAYKKIFHIQFELTRHSYLIWALKLTQEQLSSKWLQTIESIKNEFVRMGFADPAVGSSVAKGDLKSYFKGAFFKKSADQCELKQLNNIAEESEKELLLHNRPFEHQVCFEPVPENVLCTANEPDPKTLPELPAYTQKAYLKMIDNAKQGGYKFIFVLMPVQNEDLYCAMNRRYSPLFDYGVRAREFMKQHGVPVVDLRPYATEICNTQTQNAGIRKGEVQVKDLLIPGDGHMTAIGNRWVFDSLLKELIKLEKKGAL